MKLFQFQDQSEKYNSTIKHCWKALVDNFPNNLTSLFHLPYGATGNVQLKDWAFSLFDGPIALLTDSWMSKS